MTQPDYMDFDVYVNAEPVVIRGFERAEEQFPDGHPQEDEWAVFNYLHVDFIEQPQESTTRVSIVGIICEGGLSALYNHLQERGMIPHEIANNEEIPERLTT